MKNSIMNKKGNAGGKNVTEWRLTLMGLSAQVGYDKGISEWICQ